MDEAVAPEELSMSKKDSLTRQKRPPKKSTKVYNKAVKTTEDLDPVKRQAGVPADMEACHTVSMELDGRTYVIEGHVPREAVDKLISERTDIRGIAVPGMPDGSLGMGDDPAARYTVWAFDGKGGKSRFYEAGK